MGNTDQTAINPIEDQRGRALAHYQEVSTAACHWSSFVEEAIKAYKKPLDNEKLGRAIDRVENLLYALQMNLPAEMHIEQFRKTLPEIVKELKEGFVEAIGENPWE